MDHANTAYALLLTNDREEAENLSDQIQASNQARQNLTDSIIDEVVREFDEQVQAGEKLLITLGQDWPTGVLGLVAGKLCDRFNLPVFIASLFDGKIVGSGRSVAEFDVTAALQKLKDYFANFGGHPAACGFTLKNNNDFSKFQKDLQALAAQELKNIELNPVLEVEAKIDLEQVTWGLYDELEKMEPFGDENPRPLFIISEAEVDSVEKLGRDNSHLKVLVKQNNGLIRKLIGFGLANGFGELKRGDKIQVVVEVGVNEWNGNRELQLKIIDLKK
jgi:single-stranded-DNA-specific exonuclease